jgi:IS605 OrfB family transposase
MKISFAFKIEANPGKLFKLDELLVEWVRLVNCKIVELWPVTSKQTYPPTEFCIGSGLICQAAKKAWSICKSAKSNKGSRPYYHGKTIDLGVNQAKVNLSPKSTKFDGWAEVITLTFRRRVSLPFKFYGRFNQLRVGNPSAGISVSKRQNGWYITLAFNAIEADVKSKFCIGIDVGYSTAAAISTGEMHGRELESLQRRTKWRHYKCNTKKPYRQGLNRIAKKIIVDHPQSDFAVERLNFKGNRKRSSQFRTRLSRFAYQHLAQRLERLGQAEGFRVFYVNPAYTSQRCPQCGCVDKSNRNGERFKCVSCGHKAHADTNGAININGGEAVVNYVGLERSGSPAYPQQEYPGTMGALTRNVIV